MSQRFDRHEATAQARFDRLEDQVDASLRQATAEEEEAETWGLTDEDLSNGMYITDGEDGDLGEEFEDHEDVVGDAVMDAMVEAFNARDLDRMLELCRSDCEVPGLFAALRDVEPAIADLWERRPTITLTRVVDDGRAVGVLWERIASEQWGTVGTVHADVEGERVSVLQFSDDVALLDRLAIVPPEADDPLWDVLGDQDEVSE